MSNNAWQVLVGCLVWGGLGLMVIANKVIDNNHSLALKESKCQSVQVSN